MEEEILPITTQIIKAVEQSYLIAEEFYGEKIPRCRIKFDLTGTTAGTANFSKKELRFNLKLANDNQEKFLKTTVPHEVSHALQDWKHGYGTAPHGAEWKKIMIQIFHLSPKRCHSYDISKVAKKTKEFHYICQCPGNNLFVGAIKHGKIKKSPNQYFCLKYLTLFKFVGKRSDINGNPSKGLTREMEL